MLTKIPIHNRQDLANAFQLESFLPVATCSVCECTSDFVIDFKIPDLFATYRESARCVRCNLIARQRVVMTCVKQHAVPGNVIYLQEQVTNSYEWATTHLSSCTVIGSEYLPDRSIPNIRHEDVESLSFDDNSIDIIISQDVFEHVANPWQGFSECFRVLQPGGRMFMTVPFAGHPAESTVHRVQQNLPAMYHGNPLSEQGSLVYSDFGWDIVQNLKSIGFQTELAVYRSAQYGCASPVLLFELIKPASSNQVSLL